MKENLKDGAAVSPDALRDSSVQSVASLSSDVVGGEPGRAGGPTFEDTDLPVTLKACRGFSGNPTVDPDLKRLASLYTSAELAQEARSVARAHGKGLKVREWGIQVFNESSRLLVLVEDKNGNTEVLGVRL